MASRVLINNTASPVPIPDTGVTVPASGIFVIPPTQYGKFEDSSDVITYIADLAVSGISTLTVNDGTFDLSIAEGTRLIQGGFSRPISDGEDPTIKASVKPRGGIRNAMQMSNAIYVPWIVMKDFWDIKRIPLSYFLYDGNYWIYTSDGATNYETVIDAVSGVSGVSGVSDLDDFYNNYKPTIDTNKTPVGMKIIGADGLHAAAVELIDSQPSVRTFGIQAIESLRGFDPQCDTWFYLGTENDSKGIGGIGDKIIMDIAAGDDPSTYPAIHLEYTMTSGDVAGTEDELATVLAAYYNANSTFKALWSAQKISGNGVVYISARKPGGQYERPTAGDFQVSATGTTVVTAAYDDIIRRNKITGLARDPADPRQGQLGIQGSVVQTAGDVTNRFQNVHDLLVNGSITPVNFDESADPTEVKFVSRIIISGRGNNIKYGQFLSRTSLTVGLIVSFKTDDVVVTRAALKTTDDLDDKHARSPSNAKLSVQSGGDKYIAVLEFGTPVELRPQGEYTTDDYCRITVNDDLTSGITSLIAIFEGFNREF